MIASSSPPSPQKPDSRGSGILSLWKLCQTLRAPHGCPWDREQTLESLTPYMVEETYEILESVSDGEREEVAEELGDLLFLLIFCAEMVAEQGGPNLDEIAKAAEQKLRRRHPHLFEDRKEITSGDQQRSWQQLKQAEQGTKSVLGKMPKALPSLTAAYRTQEKAASVGFDWPKVEDVLAKIEEELQEIRDAMRGRDGALTRHEIGDLLFAVTNLSRYLRIDPERELRSTVLRFRSRFSYIEKKLDERGTTPDRVTLEEMDKLWEEAKHLEE